MQSVGTMIRRQGSIGTAASTGLLALVAWAAIALSACGSISPTYSSGAPALSRAVGAEQIAHNRSEEGLTDLSSVGGQQISHNRSEEGLAEN
jgi:hypothetical protein